MVAFIDRDDAGRQLADLLERFQTWHPVVVGLSCGGLPVACRIAEALDAPLDVIVVRKLALPSDPEFGVGAISEDGVIVFNDEAGDPEALPQDLVSSAINRELQVLRRRVTRIRNLRPAVPLKGRMAIVVDDGVATGVSARAACRVARRRGASSVVLAAAVAPAGWREKLSADADDFQAVVEADPFSTVEGFYASFPELTDEDVQRCLI